MEKLFRKYGLIALAGVSTALTTGLEAAVAVVLSCLAVRFAVISDFHRRDARQAWKLYDDEWQLNNGLEDEPTHLMTRH